MTNYYKIITENCYFTANPIEPSPKITTVDPFSTLAVSQAAPTPKEKKTI